MAGPGIYYTPPPVFVGGRQPYAPAQPVQQTAVVAVPANATLLRTLMLMQVVGMWQPGPITILWSGPEGATQEAPDPPVPLPARSLGAQHLDLVLSHWEPAPIPLSTIMPRLPTPAAPLPLTAPSLNTGQLALFLVLAHWDPALERPAETFAPPAHIPHAATVTGGGRLIGPDRLLRT